MKILNVNYVYIAYKKNIAYKSKRKIKYQVDVLAYSIFGPTLVYIYLDRQSAYIMQSAIRFEWLYWK